MIFLNILIKSIRNSIYFTYLISISITNMGCIPTYTQISPERNMLKGKQDSIQEIELIKKLFKDEAYQSQEINSYIQKIDSYIKKNISPNQYFQLLFIQYAYEKGKYLYQRKDYGRSLSQLNKLLKKEKRLQYLKSQISVLNIKIFIFLVSYFINLEEDAGFKNIQEYIESYQKLVVDIKNQDTPKKYQMILFASKLIYHLFWFHRARFIAQQNQGQLQQMNKLVDQQFLKVKKIVEENAFMIKVQVRKGQSIKEKVYLKRQNKQRAYVKGLRMRVDKNNKIQMISQSEIQNHKFQNKESLKYILKQQQSKQSIINQQYDSILIYLLQDAVRKTGGWQFPFLNLGMIYISKGGKEESWIKLFKNKPVIRLNSGNSNALASNCMVIQIFQQKEIDNNYANIEYLISDANSLQNMIVEKISQVNKRKALQNIKQQNSYRLNNRISGVNNFSNSNGTNVYRFLSPQKPPTKHVDIKDEAQNQGNHLSRNNLQSSTKIEPKIELVKSQQSNFAKSELFKNLSNSAFSRGIQNIGNTCYINSALQCLHKSKYFNIHFVTSLKLEGNLSKLFHRFINEMNQPGQPFYPLDIKKRVSEKNFLFAQYNQNDSIEFLSTLLSIISEQLNKSQNISSKIKQINHYNTDISKIYNQTKHNDELRCKSIVEDTFTGRYKVTYTCKQCQNDYVLFEKFNIHYLQMPVKEKQRSIGTYNPRHYSYKVAFQECNLEDCLRKFQKPDHLTGQNKMTCDKCHKQTDNDKVMEVYQANKVLILGIKRFYKGEKNQTVVTFPQTLKPEEIIPNSNNQSYEGKTYKMYAAILHRGNLQGGHYTAVCLNQNTNQWTQFNDSRVGFPFPFLKVDFRNAYAVFYQLSEEIDKRSQTQSTIQNGFESSVETVKESLLRQQLRKQQYLNLQIIKCTLLSLVKGIQIVKLFDKIMPMPNKITGMPVTSIFSEALINSTRLFKDDFIIEHAWQQSRPQLQLAAKQGESKLRHLIEYYIKTLNKQLGRGVDLIRRPFQITEKYYYKCQKKHIYQSKKLIHKLPASQNKSNIFCPQCPNAQYRRLKIEGKSIDTNKILIIELGRELKHQNQRSPSAIIQKQLKVSDIIPDCYKNYVYSLSAVISMQVREGKELYSAQVWDYYKAKWYKQDGESQERMESSFFPNAVMLFYELSGKQ